MTEQEHSLRKAPGSDLAGGGLRFATQGDAVPGGYNGAIFLLTEEGAEVGRIEYQTCTDSRWDDGAVEIAFVTVAPERRRQGWGTALVRRLEEEFPARSIRWGYTTEEGEALRLATTSWQVVDSPLELPAAPLPGPRHPHPPAPWRRPLAR